jgi:hypothetical protein
VPYTKGSILEIVVYCMNEVRWNSGRNKFSSQRCGPDLVECSLSIRNKVTVALLLLKPCVMHSTFLNTACVVEWPVLKLYWSFLITFSFRSWKFKSFQNDSLKKFNNLENLLVYNSVGTCGLYLVSEAK